MRFAAQVFLAALSGAVIAWVVAAIGLHAIFADGGYTQEALVEFPQWAFVAIGADGALVGLAAALLAGRSPLPEWVRPALLGSLAGVAAVVVPTLALACSLGGPSSKGEAPYLHAGLVYGVPVGLVVGAVAGLIVSGRHRS
jgi:hypothetical protein